MSVNNIIEFLTELFNCGYKYDTLNTARSALSSMCVTSDGFSAGSHPLVIRYMTGVFNLCPPKSKYIETWDVSKVLSYLQSLSPTEGLPLKLLTYKLVMLIALTQASRAHSLSLLTITDLKKDPCMYILHYCELLKQSKRGRPNPVLELRKYSPDRRICVYYTLEMYLARTEGIRETERRLFISYVKPYKCVSSSTVSRWLKQVMFNSGIDIKKFTSHSIRGASSSKAKAAGVPIQEIMKVAGWASELTFAKYYCKPVKCNVYDSSVLV